MRRTSQALISMMMVCLLIISGFIVALYQSTALSANADGIESLEEVDPALSSAIGATAAKKKKGATYYPGKMSVNFVYPSGSVNTNVAMIKKMRADAMTFGYRVKPAKKSSYPANVRKAIGSRKVYSYGGGIQWVKGLTKKDKKVGKYTVVDVGHKSVVVVNNSFDQQKALVQAGKRTKARVYLGLPAPQQQSGKTAWLPDLSYKGVMNNFVAKFATNYRAVGAKGYYHHTEMPISGGKVWDGTRGLYATYNKTIAKRHPGAITIIAPYLEARKAKHGATPAKSAAGAKKLMRTANGTKLFIAPQDGLGTDTTALKSDRSKRHVGTTQSHFAAMKKAVGNRLWATTEVMRPAGTNHNRTPTNARRVGQQLAAVKPYTRGSIGFMWNNGTGMEKVRGLGKYTVGVGKSFC